jgi:hypothetical protein
MATEFIWLPRSLTRDIALLLRTAFCSAVEVVRWRPGEAWCPPEGANLSNSAIYGGLRFCELVAGHLGGKILKPRSALLLEISPTWTQRAVDSTTFKEARSISVARFFKPAEEKSFPSAVYMSGADLPCQAPDLPVLVEEIVEFESEYRTFILDGVVGTQSHYRGELLDERAALDFCQRFLEGYGDILPKAVVVDVGVIKGRGWAIVEFNPLSCSSIYDCDPSVVFELLPYCLVATTPNRS